MQSIIHKRTQKEIGFQNGGCLKRIANLPDKYTAVSGAGIYMYIW